jgi:hypothetical protein
LPRLYSKDEVLAGSNESRIQEPLSISMPSIENEMVEFPQVFFNVSYLFDEISKGLREPLPRSNSGRCGPKFGSNRLHTSTTSNDYSFPLNALSRIEGRRASSSAFVWV